MKKIFSIFLCLLVLVSSTGVAMTTHYCGGYAMDMVIDLGDSHLDCGMEDKEAKQCPGGQNEANINEQACCDNVSISSETDNHRIQVSKNINTVFAIAFTYSIPELFNAEKIDQANYSHYIPPLLKRDISVLHQSFLL